MGNEREILGIKELAAAVADASEGPTSYRGRGNASDVANERTLKYYLAEGLLPTPDKKRGVSLVFERKHLLIVLAIKKLQQLGLATSVIKEALDGKSEQELDQIIKEGVRVKLVDDPAEIKRFRGMSEGALHSEFGETVQKIEIASETNAAAEYFERSLREARREDPQMMFSAMASQPMPAAAFDVEEVMEFAGSMPSTPPPRGEPELVGVADGATDWRRFEIEPGLELHVRDDYETPKGFLVWRRLLSRIKTLLTR